MGYVTGRRQDAWQVGEVQSPAVASALAIAVSAAVIVADQAEVHTAHWQEEEPQTAEGALQTAVEELAMVGVGTCWWEDQPVFRQTGPEEEAPIQTFQRRE